MGTRGLIFCVIDDEVKLAQYNQFDSGIHDLGCDVYDFVTQRDINVFKEELLKYRFVSKDEYAENQEQWKDLFQFQSRNGDEILDVIYDKELDPKILYNDINFGRDSLFCEWAYGIILNDREQIFQVYEGFNEQPVPEDSLFYSQEAKEVVGRKYYPIKLIKSFNINHMPPQREFIDKVKAASRYAEDGQE